MSLKETLIRSILDMVHYSKMSQKIGLFKGSGALLMLHHIRPGGGLQQGFAPNSGLEITPQFLNDTIEQLVENGYQLLSLADAVNIIDSGVKPDKPFAVFTIDDGYRDNLQHALPVFQRHDCPFTIFIAPDITDGRSELWWRGLEQVVLENRHIEAEIAGEKFSLEATDTASQREAFWKLYWPVRNMPEIEQRQWIRQFCSFYNVDLDEQCAREAMNWDELRQIASDPLCTIGAHTIHHYAVSKLPAEMVVKEAVQSRDRISQELGTTPEFFAYPYGDAGSAGPRDFELIKEAGFKAAVTTRKGLIYPDHQQHLTALPRLSLNGGYQKQRYTDALLSGIPFALFNRFRRVNVG